MAPLDFHILHDADDVLVIDKPPDLSLLADRSGAPNLWDLLKQHFGKLYLVHRLDKGTSGVLLIARSQHRQTALTRAFAERRVKKYYVARVDGDPPTGTHRIDLPLTKGRKSRYRIAGMRDAITVRDRVYTVDQDRAGVAAETRFRVARDGIVIAQPITGRTHQLRVHLSWIGWPIKGDGLYGPRDNRERAPRLMLHCHKLIVPEVGTFRAPPPKID